MNKNVSVRLRTQVSSLTPKVEFVKTQNNKELKHQHTALCPSATSCKEIKITQAWTNFLPISGQRRKEEEAPSCEEKRILKVKMLSNSRRKINYFATAKVKVTTKNIYETVILFLKVRLRLIMAIGECNPNRLN